jgi:DNA (cytosine-5)-methyltransferase 1
MNKLSLFSGIGGLDLAAKWAGFKTVAFVEQNKFCQQVLGKHWPSVPIISDIREVTAERLTREGINVNAIKLISGGFPCQPFSVAGKQKGKDDNRYLWPEMLRVISEFKPNWVIGENVAGIVNLALETVCTDLEGQGYEVQPILVPACGVAAPHKRERVFILADSTYARGKSRHTELDASRAKTTTDQPVPCSADMGNTARELSHRSGASGPGWWDESTNPSPHPVTEFDGQDREIERDFRGMAHGISRRVDRLKSLGNAVVPQQAFPIFAAIAAIEQSLG